MVDSPFPDYRHVVYLAPESPVSEDGPVPATNKLEKSILESVNMLHNWQLPVWRRERQPYTVMLCATERVISEDHPALSLIDQFRDSPTLGWNELSGSVLVDKSYPIRGHHFNIFEPKNVSIKHATQYEATAKKYLAVQVSSVTDIIANVGVNMELLACEDDDEWRWQVMN